MRRATLSVVGFTLATIFLIGCGGANRAPARLSGKVSYQGAAIKGGVIKIIHPEMGAFNGTVMTDGTYSMTDLPVGDYVMTIDTETINPDKKGGGMKYGGAGAADAGGGAGGGGGRKAAQGAGGGGNASIAKAMEKMGSERKKNSAGQSPGTPEELREHYTKIPSKYSDEKKSDLKLTLVAGSNTYNPELKD